MRDCIEIGPVPCDEDCQQVGAASYDPVRARLECQCFIEQLRRQFGPEPEGARLRIKSNPHDFGNYLEVVCHFDDNYPASVEYAFNCEGGDVWAYWDATSREKLGIYEPSAERIRELNKQGYKDEFGRIIDI